MAACAAAVLALMPPSGVSAAEEDYESIAARVAAAHGGEERWRRLDTLSMEREHRFLREERPFRFQIIGEMDTHRIYQNWYEPAGKVAWDGERAWSDDWGFAGRFSERYTASIGFHLVNLPFLMSQPAARFKSIERRSGAVPGDKREFIVVTIEYEAGPIRKPAWVEGPRDTFHMIIDPETYRVAAIGEERTYAGQLDMAGAAPEQDRFQDVFVIESYEEAGGLLWPERYSLYSMQGNRYAEGRFYGYRVDVDFDETWMQAKTGEHASRFDATSSYIRQAPPGDD